MFFQADVQGKRQLPWCRDSRLEDSDGLHIWIDTRHRAMCIERQNTVVDLIFANGPRPESCRSYAGWAPINRARENSPQPADDRLAIRARIADGRYRLIAAVHFDAFIVST
ncbi:MAG: hypothetical protein U0930_11765 [Pirellulales bacterium]